jgi:hypothetical protein
MALTKQERIKRREIRLMLYTLQRKWGVPADLYKLAVGTPNFATGIPSTTRTKYHIPKFITHAVSFDQKFEYDLSFLAANKNFTYGGFYVPGDRVGIVDARFLPAGVEIETKDHFLYDNKRWEIHRFERLDYRTGWYVHLRHTPGTKPTQTHERAVWSRVTATQDIEGVL